MVNGCITEERKTTRRPKTLYLDQLLTVPGERYAKETLGISLSLLLEKLLRKRLRRAGVLKTRRNGGGD